MDRTRLNFPVSPNPSELTIEFATETKGIAL